MSRANNDSRYRRSAPAPATTSRGAQPATRDLREEISRLDAQIQRLVEQNLPKAPYLISVPSDVPYRHNTRFINNWQLGTPFAKEEETLQYMSFLTHQDGEEGLIKAVGAWSDEEGNLVDEDPSPYQIYGGAANSPYLASQRKKISLNDYKTKTKGGEETVKPGGMGPVNKTQSERAHENGVSPGQARDGDVRAGSPVRTSQERKRGFDEIADASSKLRSPKPEKRPRSNSPVAASAKSPRSPGRSLKNLNRTNEEKDRLPSLLSPTLPPSEIVADIPQLLSPTLPPSIEDLLAQADEAVKASNSTPKHQIGDSVKSMPSPGPVSKLSGETRAKHERHLSSPLPFQRRDAKGSPGGRGRDSTSSPGPRRRHVIVLKYGKRNRKRVEALLKFAPRSKKLAARIDLQTDERLEPLTGSNGTTDLAPENPRKRDRDGPTSRPPNLASKRPAALSLSQSDRPTTPIPPAFKSPSLQNSFSARFSTPKKEMRTTAMRRIGSSEGVDARTPIATITRQSTPASGEKVHAASSRPSPPSEPNPVQNQGQRDDIRRAWKALNVKYFELGRSLKHEGQSLLQQEKQEKPHDSRGTLVTIDALLCFMLNLTALSYANNGSDPGWRTILPYLSFVLRVCQPLPHLRGLVSQLGAVCRQTITSYDLDRLAREPLPDDRSSGGGGSDPTPGASSSDANTRSNNTTNEDVDKLSSRRRWTTLRNDLTDNARELHRAWLDGYQYLGPDILKHHFPETWAARARDSSLKTGPGSGAGGGGNGTGAGASERLTPETLDNLDTGRFFLPLDPNTSPVEAVRFARRVLAESAAAAPTSRNPSD